MTSLTPINLICEFWLGPETASPDEFGVFMKRWYQYDEAFDEEIRDRFGDCLTAAEQGELETWKTTARGMVALIILLDQFSRNLYRGTAGVYRNDQAAQLLALALFDPGDYGQLTVPEQLIALHPLHHSEELNVQRKAIKHSAAIMRHAPAEWAELLRSMDEYINNHAAIIERFGRFPHRNELLGRHSSTEELAFLAQDGRRYGQDTGNS